MRDGAQSQQLDDEALHRVLARLQLVLSRLEYLTTALKTAQADGAYSLGKPAPLKLTCIAVGQVKQSRGHRKNAREGS